MRAGKGPHYMGRIFTKHFKQFKPVRISSTVFVKEKSEKRNF